MLNKVSYKNENRRFGVFTNFGPQILALGPRPIRMWDRKTKNKKTDKQKRVTICS